MSLLTFCFFVALVSDDDVESVFNSLARLLHGFTPADTGDIVRSLVGVLARPEPGHEMSRLRVYVSSLLYSLCSALNGLFSLLCTLYSV